MRGGKTSEAFTITDIIIKKHFKVRVLNLKFFNEITHNPQNCLVRIVAAVVLYSHLLGWKIWFDEKIIISLIPLPQVFYVFWFILLSILAVITVIRPKYVFWLVAAMIFSVGINLNILAPYWYNYALILVFSNLNLKLVFWLCSIQEIWAGLNKFNPGYKHVVAFFSSPFENYPLLVAVVALFTLLVPVVEILIGIGILIKRRYALSLTLVLHGGAFVMLSCFLKYGHIVWAWNVLIIIVVWLLFNYHHESLRLSSKKEILVVTLLALMPFSYGITTLAYPFSYRMYPGDNVAFQINGASYIKEHYQKTSLIPYLSKEIFEMVLSEKCLNAGFVDASIDAPAFLWRSRKVYSYTCNHGVVKQDISTFK